MRWPKCKVCNKKFEKEAELKLHYSSEWHRYNQRRDIVGYPVVTEALFQARQLALAEKFNKISEAHEFSSHSLCGKKCKNTKAHAQHLKTKRNIIKASEDSQWEVVDLDGDAELSKKSAHSVHGVPANIRSEKELSKSSNNLLVIKHNSCFGNVMSKGMNEGLELDVSRCFICDHKHNGIENGLVHMRKKHGLFIADIDYLVDPIGLLTYVGLKVKRDFTCLYCSERCHPFKSFDAVRNHMIDKRHCRLHYGDGGDEDEGELEDFFDYSSSYTDDNGKQLAVDDPSWRVDIGIGGAELVLKHKTNHITTVRSLGAREFQRYYRQKPRPSCDNYIANAISLASRNCRQRSIGLATVQSKQNIVGMNVLREMNRNGMEAMRTKIRRNNNVTRKLPKNIRY